MMKIILLATLVMLATACASTRGKNNWDKGDRSVAAVKLDDTLISLLGDPEKYDETSEQALAYFKANYKKSFEDYKLEDSIKCSAEAANNAELISCSWQDARRETGLGYNTLITTKELLNKFKDGRKRTLISQLDRVTEAWVGYQPKACEIESAQMLGGTGQPLLRNGCMASSAEQNKDNLLRAQGVVHRILDGRPSPLITNRLKRMQSAAFNKTMSEAAMYKNLDYSIGDLRKNYEKYVKDSVTSAATVYEYMNRFDASMKAWVDFNEAYCQGYSMLLSMYAKVVKIGDEWSNPAATKAYCAAEQVKKRRRELSELSSNLSY